MQMFYHNFAVRIAPAIVLAATTVATAQDQTVGVVRISDRGTAHQQPLNRYAQPPRYARATTGYRTPQGPSGYRGGYPRAMQTAYTQPSSPIPPSPDGHDAQGFMPPIVHDAESAAQLAPQPTPPPARVNSGAPDYNTGGVYPAGPGAGPCTSAGCSCTTEGTCQACLYGQGYHDRQCCLMSGGGGGCPWCGGQGGGCCLRSSWQSHRQSYLDRNRRTSEALFGWMVPSGNGGVGVPWAGSYHLAYADNAQHVDPRDTQTYSAQGYGVPVTVPLAPNVHQAYNYGWGIPSSRLTPVSNVAPYTIGRSAHW